MKCATVLRFTDGMGVRKATVREISDECHPEVVEHVRALTLFLASKRRGN